MITPFRATVVVVSVLAAGVATAGAADAGRSADSKPPKPKAAATCNGQVVTIFAQSGEATWGTESSDVILGTEGSDEIYAGNGDDAICALGGDDYVQGDNGADRIHAGDGNDRIWLVDRQNDVADGGSGDDSATVDWEPHDRTESVENVT